MKRFLLSIVALVITSVCFAQDVIVQKDGSTIQAKVLKVSQSEVEYKKFSNPNGPTYTISTKDLQCINYHNGTKDTFVSPNYNPGIVTNETATQFSNDQQLLNLYIDPVKMNKKGKLLKYSGLIGGIALTLGGIAYIYGNDLNLRSSYDIDEATAPLIISGIGLVGGTTLFLIGNSMQKKAKAIINSTALYQQEFKVGKNNRLMVGVDMLKDNARRSQTLGLGISYNF